MAEKHISFELKGTKDEIQAMLNVAMKVEPQIRGKRWINDGCCKVWARGENVGPANDLVAAIRKAAGIRQRAATKSTDEKEEA